jgi:hypothetical protein
MVNHRRLVESALVLALGAAFACSGSNKKVEVSSPGNAAKDTDGSTDGPDAASPLDSGSEVDDQPVSAACAEADTKHASVGCEYFAARVAGAIVSKGCLAAFVANTSDGPARLRVEFGEAELPVAKFGYLPQGSGPSTSYIPLDADGSIPPGQVGILFLSGVLDGVETCPHPSAVGFWAGVGSSQDSETYTGFGKTFRITSDVPVIAYQLLPFGGGDVHDAGATLLLPTSAWDTNYVAVNAYKHHDYESFSYPSMNILAMLDDTEVTLVPVADVEGGGGIPKGHAGEPLKFTLKRGEQAQIHQAAELTGSVLQSNLPIGLIAGHPTLDIPGGVTFQGDADHGEEVIPPVRALGSEYVGVMHEPRVPVPAEPAAWRMIGAVNGTVLSWSSNVGGPKSLDQGTIAEFITADPFVVKSQDDKHPFILLQMMVGSGFTPNLLNRGGPEVMYTVPPQQYLSHYILFTDPTFINTHLVVVRAKKDGAFADVNLDCAGALSGWQSVGDYEWTRIGLSAGSPDWADAPVGIGGCNTGRHEMQSDAPFSVTVWGWNDTTSYGYPGGMGTAPINDVVVL